jgi:hypothetical protein
MKFLLKALAVVLVIVVSVPLLTYRTVSPCSMLEKELAVRAERQMEAVTEEVRESVEDYGEEARQVVDDVSEIAEPVAEGLAAGIAAARVQRMSTGECVSELWRIKTGGESGD